MRFDSRYKPIRRGFTLVEMLTVIIIISLLAGLLLVAFGPARRTARNAVVKTEITQLDMALERYYQDYGDYPPDFVGTAATYPDEIRIPARAVVLRHLRKRFPRVTIPPGTVDYQFMTVAGWVAAATSDDNQNGHGACIGEPPEAGDGPGIDLVGMGPSQALVFWLGGLPAYTTSKELTGFSANVARPFAPRTVAPNRTLPLFEFNSGQLIQYPAPAPSAPAPALAYGAPDASRVLQPYLYFRPPLQPYVTDATGAVVLSWYSAAVSPLEARPYKDSRTLDPTIPMPARLLSWRWVNSPDRQTIKPQLIAAGLDGIFGATSDGLPPLFPSGENCFAAAGFADGRPHLDNVTNFTEKATIEDDAK